MEDKHWATHRAAKLVYARERDEEAQPAAHERTQAALERLFPNAAQARGIQADGCYRPPAHAKQAGVGCSADLVAGTQVPHTPIVTCVTHRQRHSATLFHTAA